MSNRNSLYDDNLIIRSDEIDGEKDWFWLNGDDGSWDGPKSDWERSHRDLYFKHVKKFDVCVTAGGNNGMYTRLYSNLFKTVYAFEPNPETFHSLVRNNQTDRVIKMNCGLGADNFLTDMDRSQRGNTGMSTIKDSGDNAIFPVITLDTLNLRALDFLQLDVEGYEHNVLVGAMNTICNFHPVIVLERGRTEQINKFMAFLKYEVFADSVSDTIWVKS